MKTSTFFKFIFVGVCLIQSLGLQAQVVSATINATAGNLGTQLGDQKYTVTNLTLTGEINATDVGVLRTMSVLSVLNMEDVTIVAGGYFIHQSMYYYTKNNELPDNMFFMNTTLTAVTFPKNATAIGEYAFYKCSKLTSVTIPKNITTIGKWAFSYAGLVTVNLLNETTIGENSFPYCLALKEFIVSDSNPTFSSVNGVLYNKDKTRLLVYPNAKASSYVIPEGTTSIGNHAFEGCSGLVSVSFPESVTSVGDYAFTDCKNLPSISLPNSLQTIGNSTFYNCTKFTSFTFPKNVTSIGPYVLLYCKAITSIYSKAVTPPVADQYSFRFSEISSTMPLYVPYGTSAAYKSAVGWNFFTNVIEQEPSAISETETSRVAAFADLDAIVVKGLLPGETVSVYTTLGTLLQTIKAQVSEIRIVVPVNQIYLIKVTEKRFKVAL